MEKYKEFVTKKNLVIVGGVISIVTALILLSQASSTKVELSNNGWKLKTAQDEKKSEVVKKITSENKDSKNKLMVDVKGEVMIPGIYQFSEGDRVADLIGRAGGFTVNADSKYLNLASIVEDTMVIYIPKVGELESPYPYMNGSPYIENFNNSGNSTQTKKININTATANEFENLTGIGPSRADAIIQKRNELGKFQSIEDLMQVTGIGEKMFEKIKDSIVVK
ncbi:MAG: hypothetical protein K0R71_2364 [Bacillales bacterium]|jgi:competence protein ComEA|nr:hypothetical protein [Bacillales bacterium]